MARWMSLVRRLGHGCVQIPGGVVDKGRRFHVHLAADGCASHQDAGRPLPPLGGMLDGKLGADDRFLGVGGKGGVLGHGAEYIKEVHTSVLPGAGLVGGVLSDVPIGGVGEDDHGGAAQVRLHDAEGRVGTHEQALPHNGRRLTRGPPVGVGHDSRRLLVPGQDRLYATLPKQRTVYLSCASSGDAKYMVHAPFLQSLDYMFMGACHISPFVAPGAEKELARENQVRNGIAGTHPILVSPHYAVNTETGVQVPRHFHNIRRRHTRRPPCPGRLGPRDFPLTTIFGRCYI